MGWVQVGFSSPLCWTLKKQIEVEAHLSKLYGLSAPEVCLDDLPDKLLDDTLDNTDLKHNLRTDLLKYMA